MLTDVHLHGTSRYILVNMYIHVCLHDTPIIIIYVAYLTAQVFKLFSIVGRVILHCRYKSQIGFP